VQHAGAATGFRASRPSYTVNGVKHVFSQLSRGASSTSERIPIRAAHLSWPCCCRATGHHHARHCFRAGPWQSADSGERDLFKPVLPVREQLVLAVCTLVRSQLANGRPVQSAAMARERETGRAVRAPADADGHQPGAGSRSVRPRRGDALPAAAVHACARPEPEHVAGIELVAGTCLLPKPPSTTARTADRHTLVCARSSKLPQPSCLDSHTLWLCCSTHERPVCTTACGAW
jgi:hypothetical protein